MMSNDERSNTMRKPTLSVIMGNYNDARYIGEALEAILSQTLRPAEVIVIDDGSTDNSLEVIEEFVKKDGVIKLFKNDVNKGVLFTYTRGLGIASGDYVYIASANDMVLPGFFEKSMNLLSQYPQAGLCYAELKASDGREYKYYLSKEPRYFSVDELTVTSRQRGCFYASGINGIIRRDVLMQGAFAPQVGYIFDVFAAMTAGIRHGVCYIPEIMVSIRMLPDSYSASLKRQGQALRRTLSGILLLLDTPAYEDVSAWIRETGVWPVFFPSMLCLLLKDRRYWRYLSLSVVRRALWRGLRETVGRVLPLRAKKFSFAVCNAYRRLVLARVDRGVSGTCRCDACSGSHNAVGFRNRRHVTQDRVLR